MESNPQHWVNFEAGGNVGAQIILNPELFFWMSKEILELVADKHEHAVIADIGAGTGSLSAEFLHASKDQSEAVARCNIQMALARLAVEKIINIDRQPHYLEHGRGQIADDRIVFQEGAAESIPLEDSSVHLGVSRQMLMHLSSDGLVQHFQEMMRVLKDRCAYIFTIKNPDDESLKYAVRTNFTAQLARGERYQYQHGNERSDHFLDHYFHPLEDYTSALKEAGFMMEHFIPLHPTIHGYERTHARYYNPYKPNSLMFIARKRQSA
jgi:ubiquinone/menaquinone biosynthesis C-methylase UbiE